MNGFIRGALGLALAATAGLAIAQPYGPPLAGGPADHGPSMAHGPQFRDDMPSPDRRVGPRPDPQSFDTMPPQGRFDAYGFDRQGLTADGYDRQGYDAHGFDRYGFDPNGYSADGYDRYGYDENGRDRYGRAAPAARRMDADGNDEVGLGRREDRGHNDRRGPPPGYDPGAYGYGESYGYGDSYERSWGYGRPPEGYAEDRHSDDRDAGDRYRDDRDDRDAGDRYGPARDDRHAYDREIPSYGGAMQHFADPRCSTCGPVRYDCGCRGGYQSGYRTGSLSLSPTFFYDNGGVGPIPDGGYYGGGGYVVSGSGASASSSAYASSSSRVSIGIRTGGGGHKGGHGGCNTCGGHK